MGGETPRVSLRDAKAFLKEVRALLRRGRKQLAPKPLQKIELAIEELDSAIRGRELERVQKAVDELSVLADTQLAFARKSTLREYAESIGLAIVIALFLRFFVVEAFKIPSGSMVPTLLVGDHIFVNKFIYGIRVPLTEKWLVKFKEPTRGDVIVFMFPQDHDKDFIKRVVGIPGDTVEIRQGMLVVTDKDGRNVPVSTEITAMDFHYEEESEEGRVSMQCIQYKEKIGEAEHQYLIRKDGLGMRDFGPQKVLPQHVFVMGDNRDNSHDSRFWGQVPYELIKGKALIIWYSGVKFARIGTLVR